MKKIFALGIASLVASSMLATPPIVTVNGNNLDKPVTSLTFDGDYVVIHFDGVVSESFDMEAVQIRFLNTGIQGLQMYSLRTFVSDQITVEGLTAGAVLEIYDRTGALVCAERCEGESHIISLYGCPAGVYLLRVGSECVKFVKR